MILGASLRLINLGSEAYWPDEILSLDIVRQYSDDFSGLLTYINTIEVHPVGYYVLLFGWAKIFGFGEYGIRLISVLFGLGVIVLTYLLTQLLFKDKRISLLAALFTALLPFQIEYSQEARPYIIYNFFALVAAISYWRYGQTKKWVVLIWYVIGSLAGLYLHYSYILFAIPLALFWLGNELYKSPLKERGKIVITWLIAHGIIFILYAWQFTAVLYKFWLGRYTIFGMERAIPQFRRVTFFNDIFNQLIWVDQHMPVNIAESLAVFIFKITLVLLLLFFFLKHAARLQKHIKAYGRGLVYVFYLALLPAVLFFFTPWAVGYTAIFERHIIMNSIFIAILFAFIFSLFKSKLYYLIVSLFLVSLFGSIIFVVSNDTLWDSLHRFNIVAEHINELHQPGDMVIVGITTIRSDLNYFLDPDIETYAIFPLGLLTYQDDFFSSRRTLGLIENESHIRPNVFESNDKLGITKKMDYLNEKFKPNRIWVVRRETDYLAEWFEENDWRLAMDSIRPLFWVKLYVKNNVSE